MRRIKLIVAYDGTEYSGWQIQPEAPTIEMYLDKAIRELTGENVHVTGASRTDAGVHAYGNVAVFDTESTIPGDRFTFALNRFLPDSIVIQDSWEVSSDFHPRHCNTRKTYEYRILNTAVPLPQKRNFTWHVAGSIDIEKMKEAAVYIVGEHDFKSFCANRHMKKSTVRTIYEIAIEENDGILSIRYHGDGFLYNMVRILTGTLLEVGLGDRSLPEVRLALEGKDRSLAGFTAPPQGLFLVDVFYPAAEEARTL